MTAVTPPSAKLDPGPPMEPGRRRLSSEEARESIDDNAVEPAQIALGGLGGAALAGAAVLVIGDTRRTRRVT